jgi:polyphosphate kinase
MATHIEDYIEGAHGPLEDVQGAADRYLNRELSWLDFNARVLSLADRPDVPLLERAKFLAIFSTNLDEFFQVRVAGLKDQEAAGLGGNVSLEGTSPAQQLAAIRSRVEDLLAHQDRIFLHEVVPALADAGIRLSNWEELDEEDTAWLISEFEQRIYPVLTPLAVDPSHPFPYISNLSLSLAVMVRDPDTGQRRFARVKVPDLLPRFVVLPDGERFVPLEQVIAARLSSLFPGMEIESHHPFRVTRNADLTLEEEEADDLLAAVEVELRRRRFGRAVRLELPRGVDDEIVTLLRRELDLEDEDLYVTDAPLDLSGLWNVWSLPRPDLKDKPWKSVPPLRASNDEEPLDVFGRIRAGDVLVHHPYDSFTDSVAAFIRQAATDPAVLTIKQTLYRTSSDSPIIAALIRAAEAGKQVAALVELKARFDEQANVAWARALEQVGVHVVYGMVGLKTHTKTALVVRQEPQGIRRYCHIGTGNYNEQTARIYEDIGLLTCDPEIGADLTQLFNYLTGYGRQERFRKLVVAPGRLRPTLASLIRREADAGADGRIVLKMNSLVDSDMIDALYDASASGVDIDLVIRGICCLRPGVPGLSDRIRVRSIVGRYLEHSRVFYFANGDGPGRPAYYIGSADLMPRNLDRRVEAVVPVKDAALQQRLQEVLDVNLADDVLAWRLLPDGSWRKVPTVVGVNTHEVLQERARQRNRRQEADVVRARGAE